MLNGILEIVKSFQQPTKPENVPRRKTATQQGSGGEGEGAHRSADGEGATHTVSSPR
jgi:hypothetical protein